MTQDMSEWLTEEVHELLAVSPVGLYEFIWLLRGKYPDLPREHYQKMAGDALRRIIPDEGALVYLRWPDQEAAGHADSRVISAEYWDDPEAGVPYVAVTRS